MNKYSIEKLIMQGAYKQAAIHAILYLADEIHSIADAIRAK